MATLRAGSPFPDFRLDDQDERAWTRAALLGSPCVVFFYPKDETPGCTAEACGFRNLWKEYEALGVRVVGVSRDGTESHRAFAERRRLPFTLLSDTQGSLHRACGALFLGFLPRRVSYLLDADGKVARVFESNTRATDHPTFMLEAARELAGQQAPSA